MYAAVKTIATILSLSLLVDRLGRRKLLVTSSVGTSLTLWYIGAFVTAKHIDLSKPQEKSVAGWVAIVCVYIYAVRPPNFLFKNKKPVLTPHTGILLLRLERRRMGLLRRNLPHTHQGARSLHLHSNAMALPICHRSRLAHYTHGVERRVLFLLCELFGGYGMCGVLVGA